MTDLKTSPIEQINFLMAEVARLKVQLEVQNSGRSSTPELFDALAKAQSEMTSASLDKINAHWKSKYATLSAIVEATRPALSKNGLSVRHEVKIDEKDRDVLHTILSHSSGQFTSSVMRISPPKTDIQAISSYMTYVKRICYSAIIGAVGEMDDDGEAAVKNDRENNGRPLSSTDSKILLNNEKAAREKISDQQLALINHSLKEYPDIVERIKNGYGIKTLSELPQKQFLAVIDRINEQKKYYDEKKVIDNGL